MYYIVYGILYLVSLLPLRILLIISDAFYGLIYYIIRYRRNVVMNNLAMVFPEKSRDEKITIAKKFYRNFTDNFIEAIKLLSASNEFVNKHFTGNYQIVNDLLKKGRSCQILLGHSFNWELGNRSISFGLDYTLLIVYMPISNRILNRLFLKIRSGIKTRLLSAHNMRKEMMPYRNTLYALVLVADQNPGDPKHAYWLNFFGKPAPFVTGPEKGSRAGNLPVVFCHIEKPRRGYYNLVMSVFEEEPARQPEGYITTNFVRYLENVIRQFPDLWLWSHRRWKHEWKDEYRKNWKDERGPSVEVAGIEGGGTQKNL